MELPRQGGTHGAGTVCNITPAGMLTMLHSFDSTDGASPQAGLVQATDGNFYRTTSAGGTHGVGTVFKVTPEGMLTTLHSFDSTDGAYPQAGLMQAANEMFYGTTYLGGKNHLNNGMIFKLGVFPRAIPYPLVLNFPEQALNETSAAKVAEMSNTGYATLEISSIRTTANFTVSSTTCGTTLGVGKECDVYLTFRPTMLGKVVGTLSFFDNAPNKPQTVALSGTGRSTRRADPVQCHLCVAEGEHDQSTKDVYID
jgi:uncharacterized repeat protein (TIGR03803 family)